MSKTFCAILRLNRCNTCWSASPHGFGFPNPHHPPHLYRGCLNIGGLRAFNTASLVECA